MHDTTRAMEFHLKELFKFSKLSLVICCVLVRLYAWIELTGLMNVWELTLFMLTKHIQSQLSVRYTRIHQIISIHSVCIEILNERE